MKTIFIIIVMSAFSFAQDIEFEGYGSTGYRFTNKNILNGYNQEAYYQGKLQAEIDLGKDIEAQLDFRGNSVDNSVRLKEFSLKLEYWEDFKIKIGNIKKPFSYEYLTSHEDLKTPERSYLHERISEQGYGDREFSVMAYYKYSDKRPDYPYSYYLSVSKNNSQTFSTTGRFEYHTNLLDYGISYLYMARSGEVKIKTHGLSLSFVKETKKYLTGLELIFVQDPDEGIRRKLIQMDESVISNGLKAFASFEFDIDYKVIKKIEPVFSINYYIPDFDVKKENFIQGFLGVNLYFNKRAMFRIFGDLRFTKNEYNNDYNLKDTRGILEVLVRF